MPDWTYQTLFRPIFFRLPPATARSFALGSMGRLASLPGGRQVIQFMGHMTTDPRLTVKRGGLKASTRVGLGCRFDPVLMATRALGEFGFGLMEIGPIRGHATSDQGGIELDRERECVELRSPPGITLDQAVDRLRSAGRLKPRVLARLEPESVEQANDWIEQLLSLVAGFVIPFARWKDLADSDSLDRSTLLIAIGAEDRHDEEARQRLIAAIEAKRIDGVMVESSVDHKGVSTHGKPSLAPTLETVKNIRRALGREPIVIASAGIHSPADALSALDAGADWVFVDSGLPFAGPSLPKRINEALLFRANPAIRLGGLDAPRPGTAILELGNDPEDDSEQTDRSECEEREWTEPKRGIEKQSHVGGQAWVWAWLMGLAMFVGGLLAMAIATTRVVLPYDEAMAGLTREQLSEINDRLLDFMTHDRVTLAGTMLSVGILYLTLAWFGIRRGVHWAWVTIIASAMAGFVSFFSFLGFGYFDPFHAFVTAILFQFLLLTFHSRMPPRHGMEPPDLHNDLRWKLNAWGQLLFVIHGVVLITAGGVISSVGMTTVFVEEDLEFMDTCAATLLEAHPRLVPLVAHDRATFGGMLVSTGVCTFLASLWGFRAGQSWLWWALMSAGSIAYAATIAVHWWVGYNSWEHLLPAYGGFALLLLGGALSYRYLVEGCAEDWQQM